MLKRHQKVEDRSASPVSTIVTNLLEEEQEQQQDHHDDDAMIRNPPSFNKKKSVTFKEVVTIRTIPHFARYPQELKRDLWNSSDEIRRMVQRNTIEFRAEGWDWRKVILEDQMRYNIVTGDLVHPAHYQKSVNDMDEDEDENGSDFYFSHNNPLGAMLLC
eukprot:scaffold363_cov56-Cylindrotheca_fusiformis.AAC.11